MEYIALTGIWCVFSLGAICYPWSKNRILDENKKIFNFGILWTLITLLLLSLVKMKKQRYGIPIYIASSIPTGILIYSYYISNLKNATKMDRYIFKIQDWIIKIVLFIMPLLYYFYGIMKEKISITLFIVYSLIYYCILGVYLYMLKNKKEIKAQTILVFSVITVLIFQLIGFWFVRQNVNSNNKNSHIKSLKVLKTAKIDLPIYGIYYKVEDIWNIGRPIKTIILDTKEKKEDSNKQRIKEKKEEKKKNNFSLKEKIKLIGTYEKEEMVEEIINEISEEERIYRKTALPDKLIYIGTQQELKRSLWDYKIIHQEKYYRFDNKKEIVTVFELEINK